MIKCKVCGRKFRIITHSHLSTHNLTIDDYKRKYPKVSLHSKEFKIEISKKVSTTLTDRKLSKQHKKNLSKSHMGKRHSEETRKKMSKSLKGRKLSKETKDKISKSLLGHPSYKGMTGKKHSLKTRKILRRKNFRGNHPNWKGGCRYFGYDLRKLLEYKEWRKEVFEKDDYTCCECYDRCGNGKKVILQAHHIKPLRLLIDEFLEKYNYCSLPEDETLLLIYAMKYKPFWRVENGKTLCKECHQTITYN